MLTLASSGLANDDFADRLFLSINSVRSYIRTAYRKIGVTTRSQAATWAMEYGFSVHRGDG